MEVSYNIEADYEEDVHRLICFFFPSKKYIPDYEDKFNFYINFSEENMNELFSFIVKYKRWIDKKFMIYFYRKTIKKHMWDFFFEIVQNKNK